MKTDNHLFSIIGILFIITAHLIWTNETVPYVAKSITTIGLMIVYATAINNHLRK